MWWKKTKNKSDEKEETSTKPRNVFLYVVAKLVQLIVIAIVLGLIGEGGGAWLAARSEKAELLAIETEKAAETPKESLEKNEPRLSAVLGANDLGGVGMLASENYRVGQIVLGGDVGVLSQGDEFTDLSITDIRGETLGSKNQNEGRALLTWKTSKAARSTLNYGKTAGDGQKEIDEDGFGMSHSAVLSNLDLASTYLYTVTVRDRYGNEVTSDSHAVYTGTKVVSLFELITNALQDVFGWAVKR